MNRVVPHVDILGMDHVLSGTAVDDARQPAGTVDYGRVRPLSVLTPVTSLTCDDACHPQFPHPLLRRRVLSQRTHFFITAGDDTTGDHRRIA